MTVKCPVRREVHPIARGVRKRKQPLDDYQ
nr:MAG TPA: Hepatocyte growth factor/SF, HORMONE/GROWTH FACTOR, HORMONE [Bacteriophage sp.]